MTLTLPVKCPTDLSYQAMWELVIVRDQNIPETTQRGAASFV